MNKTGEVPSSSKGSDLEPRIRLWNKPGPCLNAMSIELVTLDNGRESILAFGGSDTVGMRSVMTTL